MLTQSGIVTTLLHAGLIGPDSVVMGDVEVRDVSRRNQNFAVITSRDCYLAKQGASQDGRATVRHEAAIYRLLQDGLADAACARALPRFYTYEETHQVLILEWVRGAESLRQYHHRTGRFSTALAATLGRLLARFHMLPATGGERAALPDSAISGPAWILFAHRPPIELVHQASQGEIEVLKIVQRFDEFGRLLDDLRQEWQDTTLIHRDLKWDNCILAPRLGRRGALDLRIVDWEMASVGDPWWDVGSVFNDYLSCWLASIPMAGETAPDRLVGLARQPLPRMQPAMRAFWQAYQRQRRLPALEARAGLTLAVRYGAARLIQTAYEQVQAMTQVTGNAVCALQVAFNMLQRPDDAALRLLGLPTMEAA
jgi:aminoglycoside phosphotransferase (APT) family kinase protein